MQSRRAHRSQRTGRWASGALALSLLALVVTLGRPTRPAVADGPPPRSFTIALTGDVIGHVSINRTARRNGGGTVYDYRPMFSDVAPLIAGADLAICNLEGPIAPPGVRYAGSPRFASPAGIVASLKDVGFDRCSTATNHAADRWGAGVDATMRAFDAAGLGRSGIGRTQEDANAPVFEVNEVKVAHLSYTAGYSGQRLFSRRYHRWINLLNTKAVIDDAAAARAAGAEVVIVSIHWGNEFRSAPTYSQRYYADRITASGLVDLIVGHHAHVLQPISQVNGRWVLYGMGNFLSSQRYADVGTAAAQDGALARITVTENPDGSFTVGRPEITPTWVLHPQFLVVDVGKHLSDPTLSERTRASLRRSWARTNALLGDFVVPPIP